LGGTRSQFYFPDKAILFHKALSFLTAYNGSVLGIRAIFDLDLYLTHDRSKTQLDEGRDFGNL